MAAGCKQQTKKEKKKDKVHTQTKIGILQYELLNDYMKHYNKKKKIYSTKLFHGCQQTLLLNGSHDFIIITDSFKNNSQKIKI